MWLFTFNYIFAYVLSAISAFWAWKLKWIKLKNSDLLYIM